MPFYVRWDSKRPRAGHCSTNHKTGHTERGLSVYGPVRTLQGGISLDSLAAMVRAGAFYHSRPLERFPVRRCWIVEGQALRGRGSDGEPLLRPESVVFIGEVRGRLLDALIATGRTQETFVRKSDPSWRRAFHGRRPQRSREWKAVLNQQAKRLIERAFKVGP